MPISSLSAAAEDFQWSDAFLLGYGPLDDVHEEFVNLVARLQCASDADVPELLEALARHAKAHFEMENQWMVETEFPPRQCHIDEHAAVMKSIEEVRLLAAQGERAVVRSLADALVDWFPGHADYLDSALAQWMCKRRLGGTPVVIRRNIALG